jgi:hypothetical protein
LQEFVQPFGNGSNMIERGANGFGRERLRWDIRHRKNVPMPLDQLDEGQVRIHIVQACHEGIGLIDLAEQGCEKADKERILDDSCVLVVAKVFAFLL